MFSRPGLTFTGIISGIVISLATLIPGDVLGDFGTVSNDVGYLSFDPASELFNGNTSLPESVEGVLVEQRTPSRILYEDFLDHDTGQIRTDAILQEMIALAELEVQHFEMYCEEREEDCDALSSEVYNRWLGRRSHVAYRLAYNRLKDALDLAHSFNAGGSREHLGINQHSINGHTPEAIAFREALFESLEVIECLQLDVAGTTKRTNKLASILSLLKHNRRDHHIDAGRSPASNLLIPEDLRDEYNGQTFFSPEQLASYTGDLSLLDPPSSGFWRKPSWSIPSFVTTNFNRTGVGSLSESLDAGQIETLLDKSAPVKVIYEKDELSGRTPKMDVIIGGQVWKLKYVTHRRKSPFSLNPSKIYQKKWLGSEVTVEPVVNNLAAAIGYTIDPTYYQEKVHLYLDEDNYKGDPEEQRHRFEKDRQKMIEDLEESFHAANIRSAFKSVHRDENGRLYVEVRNATLEKKSDERTDINIGYYMRAGYGKTFKREFRAFSVFLAWIADADIKDANVKAKLVPVEKPDGSQTHRLVYSASDMGGALGTGFPNLLKKDFYKKIETDEAGQFKRMQLTYQSIFPAPLLKVVNMDDFRWIARLIGQLTREQIYEAFAYAGHPDVVAQYYTEILLRRRDQMVTAAGLMGETYTDQFGLETTFSPLSSMTDPDTFTIPGYESFFKKGKLRYKNNLLFDPEKEFFPRYWGTTSPFH